ncbi:phospholipid phosphatase 1-like [Glandiceps talaboti]
MGEIQPVNVALNALIFAATAYVAWNIDALMLEVNPDRLKDGMFNINDPTLAYPSRKTLPLSWLTPVLGWSAVIVLAIGELSSVLRGKYSLKTAIYHFVRLYVTFLFGWCIHRIWVMTTKGLLVSPRPSFLESCKPDPTKVIASQHLQSYEVCTNQKGLKDATGTFPSGHAAIAYYVCYFLMFYIQTKLPHNTPKLVPALLQITATMIPFFASLTRIVDNRHFWGDVIAGILFGVILGVWIANVCGLLPKGVAGTVQKNSGTKGPVGRQKTE